VQTLVDKFDLDRVYTPYGFSLYLNEALFVITCLVTGYFLLRIVLWIFLFRNPLLPIKKRYLKLNSQDQSLVISQATFFLQFIVLPVITIAEWLSDLSPSTGSLEEADYDPFGRLHLVPRLAAYYLCAVYLYDTFVLIFVGRGGKRMTVGWWMLMLHHIMCDIGFGVSAAAHSGRFVLRGQIAFQLTHTFFHFRCVYYRVGSSAAVKSKLLWLHNHVHLLGLPLPILFYQIKYVTWLIMTDETAKCWDQMTCTVGKWFAVMVPVVHVILYLHWNLESGVFVSRRRASRTLESKKEH
jgi:hypothetical protein